MFAVFTAISAVSLASGGTVTGKVVEDASGKPVMETEVIAFSDRPGLRIQTSTAADGTFQTSDLPAGGYSLVFWHEGFLYSAISLSVQGAGADPKPVLVRLVRLGAIEGQLIGLKGRSARVLALARSAGKKSAEAIWKPVIDSIVDCCEPPSARGVLAGADGAFRIENLPPGIYALVVSWEHAAGSSPDDGLSTGQLRYPAASGGFELGYEGATLRVQIPIPAGAGRNTAGRVDLPGPNSWYWITLSNPDQPALALATVVSDEKGAFEFDGVTPGVYELLAVPGAGERGTRPMGETKTYFGFARAGVDIREGDVQGITLTPLQGIRASTALQNSIVLPGFHPGCSTALVTLTPLEDWGVNLERKQPQVRIVAGDALLSPEPIDGLAPAKYGASNGFGTCLIADDPVLDLSKIPTGAIEAKVNRPGTVKGHAGVPGDADSPWEVILIPDDFTAGMPLMPANWFRGPGPKRPAAFVVQAQFYLTGGGGYLPYVRIATVAHDAHFEFDDVPAGRYRIAVRPVDPAIRYPELTDWQGMKRVDVPAEGTLEIDPELPKLPTPAQQQ